MAPKSIKCTNRSTFGGLVRFWRNYLMINKKGANVKAALTRGKNRRAQQQSWVVYYSPRCLSPLKWQFAFSNAPQYTFPPSFQTRPTHACRRSRCPWATRLIHARCPKRLPLLLGVVGTKGLCSKSKLPTTHNHHRRHHHHHITPFQLFLKALIAARAIFKQLNPGAAKDGAGDGLVFRRHLPAAKPTPGLPLGDT